jgi:hypothetical protein
MKEILNHKLKNTQSSKENDSPPLKRNNSFVDHFYIKSNNISLFNSSGARLKRNASCDNAIKDNYSPSRKTRTSYSIKNYRGNSKRVNNDKLYTYKSEYLNNSKTLDNDSFYLNRSMPDDLVNPDSKEIKKIYSTYKSNTKKNMSKSMCEISHADDSCKTSTTNDHTVRKHHRKTSDVTEPERNNRIKDIKKFKELLKENRPIENTPTIVFSNFSLLDVVKNDRNLKEKNKLINKNQNEEFFFHKEQRDHMVRRAVERFNKKEKLMDEAKFKNSGSIVQPQEHDESVRTRYRQNFPDDNNSQSIKSRKCVTKKNNLDKNLKADSLKTKNPILDNKNNEMIEEFKNKQDEYFKKNMEIFEKKKKFYEVN